MLHEKTAHRMSWRWRHPITYMIVLWVIFVVGTAGWLVIFQPARVYTPSLAELLYVVIAISLFLFIATWKIEREQIQIIKDRLARGRTGGFLVTLFTIAILFFAIEGFARFFVVSSDRVGFTAIHTVWLRAFWNPINSLDYRDVEPYDESLINVLVVGDSYVAGYGIEHMEDRFAGVLQQRLGAEYGVNIVAVSGWDTPTELEGLRAYPLTPDILIWSHCSNDIEYLYTRHFYPANAAIAYLASPFYVSSYIVSHILDIRPAMMTPDEATIYADPQTWQQHSAHLQEIIDYANLHQAPLIVVTWDCGAISTSGYVVDFFESQNIPTIDMAALTRDIPVSEVVASPLDFHPNEYIHTMTAQLLYERLAQEGWLR